MYEAGGKSDERMMQTGWKDNWGREEDSGVCLEGGLWGWAGMIGRVIVS